MKKHSLLDRAAHIFNSSSQKAETGFCFFEFEANLTYLVGVTKGDPISKNSKITLTVVMAILHSHSGGKRKKGHLQITL